MIAFINTVLSTSPAATADSSAAPVSGSTTFLDTLSAVTANGSTSPSLTGGDGKVLQDGKASGISWAATGGDALAQTDGTVAAKSVGVLLAPAPAPAVAFSTAPPIALPARLGGASQPQEAAAGPAPGASVLQSVQVAGIAVANIPASPAQAPASAPQATLQPESSSSKNVMVPSQTITIAAVAVPNSAVAVGRPTSSPGAWPVIAAKRGTATPTKQSVPAVSGTAAALQPVDLGIVLVPAGSIEVVPGTTTSSSDTKAAASIEQVTVPQAPPNATPVRVGVSSVPLQQASGAGARRLPDVVPSGTPATTGTVSASGILDTRPLALQSRPNTVSTGGSVSAGQSGQASESKTGQRIPGVAVPMPGAAHVVAQPGVSATPQSAGAPIVDHEATLRAAIDAVTGQGGGVPPITPGATDLAAVQSNATEVVVGTPSFATPSVVTVKGSKGQPIMLPSSGAAQVSSAIADGEHKTTRTGETSSASSFSAGQGNNQDQDSSKVQTGSVNDSQQGSIVEHAALGAVLSVSAAPTPAHTSGTGVATAPPPAAQGATAPAAHIAPVQPDPVTTPVVNSAKLIQSIQQSDMRVGLNSQEFGAISIHTSTDRGVVSSEITLGHEELAKTISAHLYTMQQELPGAAPTLSVRVDTGSYPGGDSGGLSQQSHGGRQQQYEAGSGPQVRNPSSQPWQERTMPMAAPSQDGPVARLDIRI